MLGHGVAVRARRAADGQMGMRAVQLGIAAGSGAVKLQKAQVCVALERFHGRIADDDFSVGGRAGQVGVRQGGENGFPKALDGDVQADFHLHFSSFLRFRILATEGRFTRIAPLGQNS